MVTIEQIDGVQVARLDCTALDFRVAQQIRQQLESQIEPGVDCVLDLGRVGVVDSTGFGALMMCSSQLKRNGVRLVLCALSPTVNQAMRGMRLDLLLKTFPNRSSAVAAIKSGRV